MRMSSACRISTVPASEIRTENSLDFTRNFSVPRGKFGIAGTNRSPSNIIGTPVRLGLATITHASMGFGSIETEPVSPRNLCKGREMPNLISSNSNSSTGTFLFRPKKNVCELVEVFEPCKPDPSLIWPHVKPELPELGRLAARVTPETVTAGLFDSRPKRIAGRSQSDTVLTDRKRDKLSVDE